MKDNVTNNHNRESNTTTYSLKDPARKVGIKIHSNNKLEKAGLTQIIKSEGTQFKRLNLDLITNIEVKDFKDTPDKNLSPKINYTSFKNTIGRERLLSTMESHISQKAHEKFPQSTHLLALRKNSLLPSNDLARVRQFTQRLSKKFSKNPLQILTDKIMTIFTIKNKVIEDYTKLSFKPTTEGKRDIINQWKKVLELSLQVDPKLFINSLKCLGDIYLEFDNYESAKHFYYNYKFFSFYMELLDDLIIAYESLGNVYKFMFQYHKAIKCYKKQIEISWVTNNKYAELRAYDNIGIQYFYLGDKEKAKYYHERMIYGRVESLQSDTRELVLKAYRNKNFYLFTDDKYIKNSKDSVELQRKLKDALLLFEDEHDIDLQNFYILKNQENMKNSFVSDVDMSFTIIPEKYLKDEFDIDCLTLPMIEKLKIGMKHFKSGTNHNLFKKNKIKAKAFYDLDIKHENHHVNDMILSHLSTKRKDFNTDRFRKIFERFEKISTEIKKNIFSLS